MRHPARREREVARIREDILLAAARAFARNGYKDATMHDIAREAGYTAPSLYGYFRSKDEIFVALEVLLLEDLLGTLDERPPTGATFPQRLELLVRRQLELAERRREAISIFVPHHRSSDGAIDGVKFERYVRRLATWLRRASAPAPLGPREATDAAWFLWGACHAFWLRWLHGGLRRSPAEHAPALTALVLRGLGHRAVRRRP